MIIKNLENGDWQELYPKTLAENVHLDNGKTVQEQFNMSDSIEIIEDSRENQTSRTVVINNKFFFFSATAKLTSVTQNKYVRSSVLFPFNNAVPTSLVTSALFVESSSSAEDTTHLYVREKHANRVQISTIGTYTSSDTVTVDVQVTGMLA